MWLGYNFLNLDSELESAIPTTQSYSQITFTGESWLDNINMLSELPSGTVNFIDSNLEYDAASTSNNAVIAYVDNEVALLENNALTNALNTLPVQTDENGIYVDVPDDYILEKKQLWSNIKNIQMFLANFEDSFGNGTLSAGNVNNGSLPITKWALLRRRHDVDLQYTEFVVLENNNITQYFDYLTKSNEHFDYAIQAITTDSEGNDTYGILIDNGGSDIVLSFFGWTLASLDSLDSLTGEPTTFFHFDAEIQTGDIKTNTDEVRLENYSQFPVFSSGLMNFEEIPITAVPYKYVDGEFTVNEEIYTELRNFITNKQIKVLRNGSGRVMKVYTTIPTQKYMDKIANQDNSQPYSISFLATQVGEVIE